MLDSAKSDPSQDPGSTINTFRKAWIASTADSNQTLHGFCRFKTAHLLNLRLLEDEVAQMDNTLYQAGLSLDLPISSTDRLRLNNIKRDPTFSGISATITPEFVQKFRDLLKQYDEALASFNVIMNMETFSLLDDQELCNLRNDIDLEHLQNTRMLRVDLGTRARTDPFERSLHKYLRDFRFKRLSRRAGNATEGFAPFAQGQDQRSYQNTIFIAQMIGRTVTAILTGVFLIVPLVILSYQPSKDIQLVVIAIWILVLSLLVSLFLKVSSFEMMAVSAAYAAVLSVFVSSVPATT